MNGRLTNFLKFESRVESIGRRVRRVAVDLTNYKLLRYSARLLEQIGIK